MRCSPSHIGCAVEDVGKLHQLGSERPRNRLFNVGGNWMQRREYRSVADDLATIDAVTLDDIHAVLAKYPLSKASTVTVGPLAELAT